MYYVNSITFRRNVLIAVQQYIQRRLFSKFYFDTQASLQLVYHENSLYAVFKEVKSYGFTLFVFIY